MEPIITFGFNNAGTDIPWEFTGVGNPETGGWKVLTPVVDKIVFTGGGIDDADNANGGLNALGNVTIASGIRSATIRPSATSFVIPYTYIEKDQMYYAKYCGHNTNRYAMGVRVQGTATSDLYMEAWDDNTFSTTNLELLSGTAESEGNSFISAIRTTLTEPPWAPGWNGDSAGAAYLRGSTNRVALSNTSTITDSTLYYNMYIRLPIDCSTFNATPVISFRYLYT